MRRRAVTTVLLAAFRIECLLGEDLLDRIGVEAFELQK